MAGRLACFVALSLVALLAVGGCGSEEDTSSGTDPEWLFSLQANGLTAFDEATGQLTMPVDSVHAFTDRPDRFVDLADPRSFADLWKDDGEDSSVDDPPNVISWWPSGGGSADSMEVASIVGAVMYDAATSSTPRGTSPICVSPTQF